MDNTDANADGSVAERFSSFSPCCGSDSNKCDDVSVDDDECVALGSNYCFHLLVEELQGLTISRSFYRYFVEESLSVCEFNVDQNLFCYQTSSLIQYCFMSSIYVPTLFFKLYAISLTLKSSVLITRLDLFSLEFEDSAIYFGNLSQLSPV